jgi:spermidine synthase/MFS family permease
VRFAPFLAFFLSGASSLIFQSIWTRYLHHVFGSTTIAMSTVLSVFMAGLGLGAWIFGKVSARIKHPLMTYAAAELLVAVCAIAIPWLVAPDGWLGDLNAAMRASFGDGSAAFAVARFAAVVPILIVPTTLMGSTLPLLSQHFVEEEQRAGATSSRVGVLYAVNTFGAVAGTFLSGFVLLPGIGLAATNFTAAGMNLFLAAAIFALHKQLLGSALAPGERLSILPGREPIVRATPTPAKAAQEKDDAAREEPISPLARKLALVAFGVSGAAALCYEVVWTRALAQTIGSSIYTFTLVLMTFLIGIAGGSAMISGLLGTSRRPLLSLGLVSGALCLLANAPVGVGASFGAYLAAVAGTWAVLAILGALARARAQKSAALGGTAGDGETTVWGLALVAVPLLASLAHLHYPGHLSGIVASVTGVFCAYLAVSLALRRTYILLVALIQLLIAAATFVNYLWADEIPLTFASLVAPLGDRLADNVGLVRFFMFLTAGLCTLPATFGMGAMFPLTLRIWSSGGRNVGADVAVVYTSNTIGSILGAWLPGFVLFALIGAESTLHLGVALNLVLALMMLLATAADVPDDSAKSNENKNKSAKPADSPPAGDVPADGEKKGRDLPAWQAGLVYVFAPLIPALLALGWLVTANPSSRWSIRWDQSKMTLGVFRVSLAADVLDPERWGQPDIVYFRDGLSTTVTVERWGRHLAMKNNGKVDASNGDDMPTQIMVGAYPLLMHEKGPRDLDVAVIGFGSGVTVGSALRFPVKSVDVVELERSIPEASKWFADVNHLEYPLSEFPYVQMDRLRVVNDDGRNYLASTTRKYDIIMSEPSNPWITGVSDLFTTDHFRIAKRALKPDGIYCQWVQLYELSPANIKTIYRTFASQFRYVVVFAAENLSSDTVVLGSDVPLPLDLGRVQRAYDLPGVAAMLDEARVGSPYDVFSRVILASRDEVMAYTRLREQREGGGWITDVMTSNGPDEACTEPDCRLVPAVLNTDDNARIEFAAPDDLIGFQRYEGYLGNIYSEQWPYGRLADRVQGFGRGDEAARHHAEQALSLMMSGRRDEAARFVERSQRAGRVREMAIALETLALLMSEEREPRVQIEPPVPGPQMDRRTAERLTTGFDAVKQAVDQSAWATALSAMEEIPAPLRLHSGPGMRFLYGYLLYKGASGVAAQHRAAIDTLEELVREDEDYVLAHPEVFYFLARAHDAELNHAQGVRSMRRYVEARVVPAVAPEPAAPEPAAPAAAPPSRPDAAAAPVVAPVVAPPAPSGG